MPTTDEIYALLGPDQATVLKPFADPILAEALAAGQTPQAIVDAIENAIDADTHASYAARLYWTFGGGSHYESLNLMQALGLQPPDVIPEWMKGQKARSASDALALAAKGWSWQGMQTTGSSEQVTERLAATKTYPAEYNDLDPDLRYVAIMTGALPFGRRPFGAAPPHLDDYRGYSLQEWLDVQWALYEGRPVPSKAQGKPMRGRG